MTKSKEKTAADKAADDVLSSNSTETTAVEKTPAEKAAAAAQGAKLLADNKLTATESANAGNAAGGAGAGYQVPANETSYEHSPDAHRPTPEVAQQVDQEMGLTKTAPEAQPTQGADPAKVEAARSGTSTASSTTASSGPKVKARTLLNVNVGGKDYPPNVLVEGSQEEIASLEKAGRVDTSAPAVRAVSPAANDGKR